ncbi:LexA family protein [Fictibacillus nanhaiensis]|uniref:LexA family protein n=1 Tax=Fictibacillus nanhaiensis TaxID=742169 RepID=UPI003C1B36A4
MSLGNQIKNLRRKSKLTQMDLAKKLGVSRSAINMWEHDDRKPSIPVLKDMAELFSIELMDLLKYIIDENKNEKQDDNSVQESPTSYSVTDYLVPDSTVKIPIVGQISCGSGGLAYEEIQGYEDTPASWLNGGEYFYLRAKGDSMMNARIFDGDLVLIRSQPEVEDGEIAAVLIDDEAVLKRVYKRDDTLILQSENPLYPPKIVKNGVQILGKLKKIVINM